MRASIVAERRDERASDSEARISKDDTLPRMRERTPVIPRRLPGEETEEGTTLEASDRWCVRTGTSDLRHQDAGKVAVSEAFDAVSWKQKTPIFDFTL